jgi:hypothetical protein
VNPNVKLGHSDVIQRGRYLESLDLFRVQKRDNTSVPSRFPGLWGYCKRFVVDKMFSRGVRALLIRVSGVDLYLRSSLLVTTWWLLGEGAGRLGECSEG